MQSEQVRAFKNDFRSYSYWLSRVITLENSIEYCYDRLGGVKGIDPSKEPTHAQPNKELEWKLRDDISRYEAELAKMERRIKETDEILDRIENDLREAIKSVYIQRQQIRKIADKYFLSYNGLSYRMDRAIERALDEKD